MLHSNVAVAIMAIENALDIFPMIDLFGLSTLQKWIIIKCACVNGCLRSVK